MGMTVGAVFTPAAAARFAVAQGRLADRWLAGAVVLDPTMGDGALLAALVEAALESGRPVSTLPFHRLWGVEQDAGFHAAALKRFQAAYGVSMDANFRQADFFETPPIRCSLLLGNPPWIHYSDLPESWKPDYRRHFVRYRLVADRRQTLLGRSRVDVAALVVQKAILECLEEGGEAWFFLPLSLFLNDGAHTVFRGYQTSGVAFAPREFWDAEDGSLFPQVGTRHALVRFQRDAAPRFPVPYHIKGPEGWKEFQAAPRFHPDDPLCIQDPGQTPVWQGLGPIPVSAPPRQGVNTGGANGVYFFDRCEAEGDLVRVDGSVDLPRRYVHPLITAALFRDPRSAPQKWVLVPHRDDGAPLTPEEVENEPLLRDYLRVHEAKLRARRGVLIGNWISRGRWWALLGMGSYSFAPFKVVWEAYGRRRFLPLLVPGTWQVNQSLQAYLPCGSEAEGLRVLARLQDPAVEAYLASFRMGGTMGWAQPGRLGRLLDVRDGDF